MGLFDFLRGKHEEKTPEEIEAERIRAEKTAEFKKLIAKFEFPDLEKLCDKVLGMKPPKRFDIDKSGERLVYPLNRWDYEQFVMAGNFTLEQIKDFAIKYQIVPPSFFGNVSENNQDKKEFENIINSVQAQFRPEKITGEEHLQAQLAIFLKAKYPEYKIEREVTVDSGRLDIVVNGKYVFEVKVYLDKNQLRDLGAQLEEYKNEYPNVCAIIMDTEKSETSLWNIREYSDKYKVKYGIQSIILQGEKK